MQNTVYIENPYYNDTASADIRKCFNNFSPEILLNFKQVLLVSEG